MSASWKGRLFTFVFHQAVRCFHFAMCSCEFSSCSLVRGTSTMFVILKVKQCLKLNWDMTNCVGLFMLYNCNYFTSSSTINAIFSPQLNRQSSQIFRAPKTTSLKQFRWFPMVRLTRQAIRTFLWLLINAHSQLWYR